MSDDRVLTGNEYGSVRKRLPDKDGISVRLTVHGVKTVLEQIGALCWDLPDGRSIWISVDYDDMDMHRGEQIKILSSDMNRSSPLRVLYEKGKAVGHYQVVNK